MDIRYRLFPYPVLSYLTDDYINSVFKADVSVEIEPYNVCISVAIQLDNIELVSLIESGAAEYVCHIECPQTAFREIKKSNTAQIYTRIPEGKLNGEVNVCTFIVAQNNLPEYSSRYFNPDYENRSFYIEKGGILAYSTQTNITIDKETEEFSRIPSIFVILKKVTDEQEPGEISLDSDKIKLKLCENEYLAYQKIVQRFEFAQTSHAMIILPSLIYTIDRIKADGCDIYSEYRWFRAIKKKLLAFDIDLSDSGIDSFRTAQILLDMPMNRGLIALANTGCTEEDEE